MSDELPYVTRGYEVPPEQPVVVGQPAEYVGIYMIDEEPRIVMTLTNPPLAFGRVENWEPEFACTLPITIQPSERRERFFQICFTGVPSERRAARGKLCVRSVRVTRVSRMFEGENPPLVR